MKRQLANQLNINAQKKAAQGAMSEALTLWQKSLAIAPEQKEIQNQLGHAYTRLNRFQEALGAYRASIAIDSTQANAFYNLGNTFWRLGHSDDALNAFSQTQQLDPSHAAAWHNAGCVWEAKGRMTEAEHHFRQAVALQPNSPDMLNRLGRHLTRINKLDEALLCHQKAQTLNPKDAPTTLLVGGILLKQGCNLKAVNAFENACRLAPQSVAAWTQLGVAQANISRRKAAKASYTQALKINPNQTEALNNLGILLKSDGQIEEAVEKFDKAIALQPNLAVARMQRLHQLAHMCAWDRMEADLAYFKQHASEGSPFAWLALKDDPLWQLNEAIRYAAQKATSANAKPWSPRNESNQRIHVAYFSADFHNHATMHLMIRLFELHDRARFCVHAFSYGPVKDDSMRTRLIRSVEHFHDVGSLGDAAICEFARQQRIDVAVDLKGYTGQSRSNLFALRLAPVQISYLGYPGTTGSPCMDYIIADQTLVPKGSEKFYSEAVIRLPNSYQINDDQREISPVAVRRSDENLPDGAFVFCCFNASYKISAAEFGVWMRLLRRVENSVLWLLESNPWAKSNLALQAKQQRIDPSRLIFASKKPLSEHLARHKLADLFLDTFACNAHTTASDALWAGLPLLTMQGKSFAARVASSLLVAVGLPELITSTADGYERLALELAQQPSVLAALRERLAQHRSRHPLFRSELTVRHIESALEQAHARHTSGMTTLGFDVSAIA